MAGLAVAKSRHLGIGMAKLTDLTDSLLPGSIYSLGSVLSAVSAYMNALAGRNFMAPWYNMYGEAASQQGDNGRSSVTCPILPLPSVAITLGLAKCVQHDFLFVFMH